VLSRGGFGGAVADESWAGPGTDSRLAGKGGDVIFGGGLAAVGGGSFCGTGVFLGGVMGGGVPPFKL
jgi:hypothetical protein